MQYKSKSIRNVLTLVLLCDLTNNLQLKKDDKQNKQRIGPNKIK